MRVLRWAGTGLALGALTGFAAGLLGRRPRPDGSVCYVPPDPSPDQHAVS